MRSFFKFVAYLLCPAVLAGCLVTPIPAPKMPKNIYHLQALNQQEVELSVTSADSLTLGRQYLLVVIPFGRIVEESPTQTLYNLAFQELALRGYKTVSSAPPRTRQLTISLQELSLNAYDFIFFRKITVHITLKLSLSANHVEVVTLDNSEMVRAAFAPQLSALYHRTLAKVLSKGFAALGLQTDRG